jgi:hypothetical protein
MTSSLQPPASSLSGRLLWKLSVLILAFGFGVGVFFALRAGRTIFDLFNQNRALREAIANLTEQRQIGYAKVLSQETRNGVLTTRLLFVVTDPQDQRGRLLEREYEIEGDIVFFDALIVKFGPKAVMDGKEKAMYLWRRVYGENTPPARGFAIEIPGKEPARYGELFKKLSLRDRRLFWDEIWKLSDDPSRLAAADVQAIYGSALYKKVQPGLIYVFNLDAGGTFYPQTVPAL